MFDAIATQHPRHGGRRPASSAPGLHAKRSAAAVAGRDDAPTPLFGGIAAPRVRATLSPEALSSPPEPRRMFGAIEDPLRHARPLRPGELAPVTDAARGPLFSGVPTPWRHAPGPAALPAPPGTGAPSASAARSPPGLFGGLVRQDLGARLARRGAWTLIAGVFQAAAIAGLAVVTAHLGAPRAAPPVMVDVRFIRPMGKAARPGPPPPPAAPAPRRTAAVARPRPAAPAKPPSPLAIHQPREVAPVVAPAPPGAADEADYGDGGPAEGGVEGGVIGGVEGGYAGGVEGGVFGGVPGGVVGGAPVPPVEPVRRVVKFDRTMKAPVLVSAPPLEYTAEAMEREVEGTMVVECVVAVDGTVHACRVLAGLPYMDRAVISNLERRRYRPATLDGKPLDVEYTFTIRFKLPE